MHVLLARMTAKLHRPAKQLIGVAFAERGLGGCRGCRGGGDGGDDDVEFRRRKKFKLTLTLANYIAHFHTSHRYAVTYGKAGNVTFSSFLKVSDFRMFFY